MKIELTISEIIDARLSDIAIAKKCITTAGSDVERHYFFQCAVLTIYASLEGGVKDIVGLLLQSINTTVCSIDELTPCYATIALSKVCKLDQNINDFKKQIKTTTSIVEAVLNRAKLPDFINTESNLAPSVIERICKSIDIPSVITDTVDENDLNILIRFRNNIAHGDRKMPIDFIRIDQLSRIAIKVLCSFGNAIFEAYLKKIWLTSSCTWRQTDSASENSVVENPYFG